MSFFAEIFITLMILAGVCLLLAISCRLIELIWMSIYACFAPFMCPNRHREPWPVELCNILIMLIICIDNTFKCPAGSLESSTAFECKVGKCCIGLPKTCKTDNVAGDCGPVAKWACKPAISGGTKNYCFEK